MQRPEGHRAVNVPISCCWSGLNIHNIEYNNSHNICVLVIETEKHSAVAKNIRQKLVDLVMKKSL